MAPTYHPVWVYEERGVEMLFSRQDQRTLETDWPKGRTEVLGHARAVMDFSAMSLKRGEESLPVKRYMTLTNYIWVVSFNQKEYPLPLKGCILLWILYEKRKGSPFAVTMKNFISGQDVACIIQFHGDGSRRVHSIINQFNKEKGDLVVHETTGTPMRDEVDTLEQMRIDVEAEWENMRKICQYPPPPPTLREFEGNENHGTIIRTSSNPPLASIRNIPNRGYVRPAGAPMKDKPIYAFQKPHTVTETHEGVDFSTTENRPTNPIQKPNYMQGHDGRRNDVRLVGEVRQRPNPSHPIYISPTRPPNRVVSIVPPRNEVDYLTYLKLTAAFIALFLAMREWA